MRSTQERHLHEWFRGLYCVLEAEAIAMNKIVMEHYPVEKLPEDLRARFFGQATVRLTVENERPSPLTREDILAFLDKPIGEPVNTVEGIRALRDEWD